MNDRPLRAAVIGAGRISAEHLKFLRDAPNILSAGVCDLSVALGEFAVDRYGVESAFTSHIEMLEKARPDVVHVLTPPHTHVALTRDCIDAGAHVIVEKPVTPTNVEFQELWQYAQDHEKVLIEDHNYRFVEPVLAIEQMILDGKLGDVQEVEVRMVLGIAKPGGRYSDTNIPHPSHGLPAGVLQEFLPHLSYLMLRFVPSFERLAVAWTKHSRSEVLKYDDIDAIVEGGGVHGRIRFTAHQGPDCFMVRVRGTKGWVETDLFCPYLRYVGPRSGPEALTGIVNLLANGMSLSKASFTSFMDKILQKTAYEGLGTFLEQTYSAITEDGELPVTYDDMDMTSRLVEALVDEENRI